MVDPQFSEVGRQLVFVDESKLRVGPKLGDGGEVPKHGDEEGKCNHYVLQMACSPWYISLIAVL